MDSSQIQSLISSDPYLKKIQCYIIFQEELPTFIEPESIYFILIPNGRAKKTGKGTFDLGHWILLDFLKDKKGKGTKNYEQISYFDPYGRRPTSDVLKKLKGSARFMQAKLFVNSTVVQTVGSLCGVYSAYAALLRARGFSYKNILTKKISKRAKLNIKILPDLIASLLPRENRKLDRFSLDFI